MIILSAFSTLSALTFHAFLVPIIPSWPIPSLRTFSSHQTVAWGSSAEKSTGSRHSAVKFVDVGVCKDDFNAMGGCFRGLAGHAGSLAMDYRLTSGPVTLAQRFFREFPHC